MKVSVDISAEYTVPVAIIYTDRVTEEIQKVIDTLQEADADFKERTKASGEKAAGGRGTMPMPITALQNEEDIVILQPKEIFLVKVEGGDTMIYTEKQKYRSRRRLYELKEQLGNQFMQISKASLINLREMDSIEPGFSGTMLLKLKNGCKEYVSRTYLPGFKKYLGL